jgi:hypothetical protein
MEAYDGIISVSVDMPMGLAEEHEPDEEIDSIHKRTGKWRNDCFSPGQSGKGPAPLRLGFAF